MVIFHSYVSLPDIYIYTCTSKHEKHYGCGGMSTHEHADCLNITMDTNMDMYIWYSSWSSIWTYIMIFRTTEFGLSILYMILYIFRTIVYTHNIIVIYYIYIDLPSRLDLKHPWGVARTSTFSASMIGCESTRRTGRAACGLRQAVRPSDRDAMGSFTNRRGSFGQ